MGKLRVGDVEISWAKHSRNAEIKEVSRGFGRIVAIAWLPHVLLNSKDSMLKGLLRRMLIGDVWCTRLATAAAAEADALPWWRWCWWWLCWCPCPCPDPDPWPWPTTRPWCCWLLCRFSWWKALAGKRSGFGESRSLSRSSDSLPSIGSSLPNWTAPLESIEGGATELGLPRLPPPPMKLPARELSPSPSSPQWSDEEAPPPPPPPVPPPPPPPPPRRTGLTASLSPSSSLSVPPTTSIWMPSSSRSESEKVPFALCCDMYSALRASRSTVMPLACSFRACRSMALASFFRRRALEDVKRRGKGRKVRFSIS